LWIESVYIKISDKYGICRLLSCMKFFRNYMANRKMQLQIANCKAGLAFRSWLPHDKFCGDDTSGYITLSVWGIIIFVIVVY